MIPAVVLPGFEPAEAILICRLLLRRHGQLRQVFLRLFGQPVFVCALSGPAGPVLQHRRQRVSVLQGIHMIAHPVALETLTAVYFIGLTACVRQRQIPVSPEHRGIAPRPTTGE